MIEVVGDGLVGIALLASVAYAVLALGPQALRRRLSAALAARAARRSATTGLAPTAGIIERLVHAKAAGGCGGCGGCEGAAPAGHPPGDAAPGSREPSAAAEVRIPAAGIKLRRNLPATET
jgi:hypothetical protein